jgi:NADH:ubiquinone oxidoreductase subunit C
VAEFVAENLRRRFGEALERISDDRGDLTIWTDRSRVHELLEHCKRDPELDFCFCMGVTAVDYLPLGGTPRFAVVYHLYSLRTGKRVRIRWGFRKPIR